MAENKENIDDLYELLNLLKTGKDKVLYVIYHYWACQVKCVSSFLPLVS